MAQKSRIFAISGCTNSGKTTFAQKLATLLGDENTTILNQDDFYYSAEKVEKLYMTKDGKDITERGFFYSYDEKESIDVDAFRLAILEAASKFEHVIVEGNMLTEMESVLQLFTKVLVLTLDMKTCKTRRDTRVYDPPDDIGYFEYVAWPAYQRHLKRALEKSRKDDRFTIVDVSEPRGSSVDESMNSLLHHILNNHLKITENVIDIDEIQKIATSSSCGAISIFVGTTRDNFEGKTVKTLSYDCYDEMAYKELLKICDQIRLETPSVEKIVMFHRIGVVPVGEASVIIATSSPHRAEAIKATERAINLLKKTVPIWKMETYENGESCWKTNKCNGHTPEEKSISIPEDVNKLREQLKIFVNL